MKRLLLALCLLCPAVGQASSIGEGHISKAHTNKGRIGGKTAITPLVPEDPLYLPGGTPTLDFNFATQKNLTDAVSGKTSLVNFSRSAAQSPGTYVGADGLIHDAAVNLALYSEQFDNAAFLKLGSGAAAPIVTANQTTAPDGKQTAEKIVLPAVSATNNYSIILRTQSGAAAGAYTYSVYLRGNVGGETIYLTLSNAAPSTSKECVLTTSWQRCSIDYVNPGGTIYANFGVDLRDPTESAQPAQTVFAWGAQLEETDPATMQPTAYIKTTSQALAAPRFDHAPTTGNLTTNLITYSEMFDQSVWVVTGGAKNVTTGFADPFGGTAADKLTPDASTQGALYQNKQVQSGTTYTQSVYAKAGEFTHLQFGTWTGFPTARVNFNLSAGTIGANDTGGTATITDAGNGWYRCTLSLAATSTTASGRIFFKTATADDEVRYAATGDGTSGIYLYGAQLEASPTPGPYVRTLSETRSISDANAESLGLLVEEARANAFTNSEDLSAAGLIRSGTGVTPVRTLNYGVAPDGTQTAERFVIDRGGGTTSGDFSMVRMGIISTTNQNAIWSFYAKSLSGDAELMWYGSTDFSATVNIKTQTIGNDWVRLDVESPAVVNPSVNQYLWVGSRGTFGGDDDLDVLIWGVQAEKNVTFPTSYIPTVTSQYRYADVAAVQDEDFSTTNLLAYSESFDVGWTKTADVSFSANAIVSPDGQTTAEKFEFSGSSIKRIYRTGLPSTVGVFSVYAKAGEETTFSLWTNGASRVTIFDLSSASVVSSNATWSSIKPVGDGWYLCQHYYGGSATTDVNIYGRNGSGAGFTPASNGDGLYFWGASLTATEYPVEYVTTRNLLTDSQDFERGSWAALVAGGAAAPVINNDFGQAPDGTNTADKIDFGDTSDPTKFSLVRNIASNLVVGKIYRASIYAKAATASDVGRKIYFYFESMIHEFTLTSEWQRLEFWNAAGATSRFFIVGARGSNTPQPAFSALVWGAQMEPVPDIVTTATDYVRTVDVVGKDYQWYEPTEGTVFVNFNIDKPISSNQDVIWSIDRESMSSRMTAYRQLSTGKLFFYTTEGNVNIDSGVLASPSTFFSSATSYSTSGSSVAINGTSATSLSALAIPLAAAMRIAQEYGGVNLSERIYIKRLTYWPRRQADSTLQVITQ